MSEQEPQVTVRDIFEEMTDHQRAIGRNELRTQALKELGLDND